jgi:secreted trypsin-like serine protease
LKYAYVGLYDPFDDSDYEVIPIIQHYVHHNFDVETGSFDQMVVQLAYASDNQWVRLNFDENIPTEGQEVTVIGYDATEENGESPDVLQRITVDYISNEDCEGATDGATVYEDLIGDDMMCTLDPGEGQCNGDSGGPYLSIGASIETDLQVGILSW